MKKILNPLFASRPFLWINTAFPFAAGWIAVGQTIDWRFWVGIFFFLFPYNLAMYGINDIFDYESDIKNPRKASIEGAQLRKSELNQLWYSIALFCIPCIAILGFTGTLASNLMFAFSLFMVIAYSAIPFRFKEIPIVDSFTSSCHFVTPLLFGILYAGGSLFYFVPAIIAFLLWGIASHAFGAIQDIQFDREANIGSIATVFGAQATVVITTICYTLSALIVFLAFPGTAGVIVSVGVACFALNTIRFYAVTDATAHTTNTGWRVFMSLSLGLGALITTGYLYFVAPFSRNLPQIAPVIISVATFFFFWKILKRK